MTALDLMQQDIDSIVGKTVEYDYGSSRDLLIFEVKFSRVIEETIVVDGENVTVKSYAVSPDGTGYYLVYKSNCRVVDI